MKRKFAVGALLFALLATGCTSWDAHAFTAQGIRDAANASKLVYREVRVDHLRDAGLRVRTSGGDDAAVGAAVDAAALEFDTAHVDLREAHAIFAETSIEYTRLVYAAVQGQAESADNIVAAGRAAIVAYNRVAAILRRHGMPELPDLPPGAAEFLRVLVP
jgi:hypothetical protein